MGRGQSEIVRFGLFQAVGHTGHLGNSANIGSGTRLVDKLLAGSAVGEADRG